MNNNRNNTRRIRRSFGQRNLFNPTRNNRNAQWSRYGQAKQPVYIEESNYNVSSPLTYEQREYSKVLSNSRKSIPQSKLARRNVGLTPIQAKIFANVHSSTNSYNEMSNKLRKMPISNVSRNTLLAHIAFLKQSNL